MEKEWPEKGCQALHSPVEETFGLGSKIARERRTGEVALNSPEHKGGGLWRTSAKQNSKKGC